MEEELAAMEKEFPSTPSYINESGDKIRATKSRMVIPPTPRKTIFGLNPPSESLELSVMDVRCTCGKVFFQPRIERMLEAGWELKEIMDQMGYKRQCCLQAIMGAPPIVSLQKKIENLKHVEATMKHLTLENTSSEYWAPVNYNNVLNIMAPPEEFEVIAEGMGEFETGDEPRDEPEDESNFSLLKKFGLE